MKCDGKTSSLPEHCRGYVFLATSGILKLRTSMHLQHTLTN